MAATVLLTLDGSEKDDRAFPVAAALAALAEGEVHMVRIVDPSSDGPESLRASAEQDLSRAADRMIADRDSSVSWEVVADADVATALLRWIGVHEPDFVVMATRAAGAVGRAIHGSVADQLIRESPRPVVLVPPRASHLRGKHVELRRVLVPLDGSPAAQSVIEHLTGLARASDLEIVLIQAVHPEGTGGYMMPPGIASTPAAGDDPADSGRVHVKTELAETRLNDVAERLRARGAVVEVRVVESGDPATAILDAIRIDLVDFIAMTTRGESGVRRMVLGSVAENVLRKSEIPVLLVTS